MVNLIFDKLFKENINIFLTGAGGTGKTYTVQKLIEKMDIYGINYLITASTGLAAKNLSENGLTIHKALALGIENNLERFKRKKVTDYQKEALKALIPNLDLLIIDEVSMISKSLFDIIIYQLQKYEFKGRLLLIGDLLQLPPVIKQDNINFNNVNDGNYYFFYSDNFKYFEIINLTEVKRTTNKEFIEIINNIRIDNITNKEVDFVNSKTIYSFNENEFIESINQGYITLTSTNNEANKLNKIALDSIEGEEIVFKAYFKSFNKNRPKKLIEKEKRNLINSILVDEEIHLKIGAKVIIVANDKDNEYINGDKGIIIDKIRYFNKEINDYDYMLKVKLENSDKIVNVKHKRFDNNYIDKDGNIQISSSLWQIPVKLAYAITIHKSQGLSLDKIVINVSNIFTDSQFYVAISRATNPDTLFFYNNGYNIDLYKLASVNPKALYFYNNINEINNIVKNKESLFEIKQVDLDFINKESMLDDELPF